MFYVYSKSLKAFFAGHKWMPGEPASDGKLYLNSLPTPYFMLTSGNEPRPMQECADALNIAAAGFNHVEAMKPENQKFVVVQLMDERIAGPDGFLTYELREWTPPAFADKTFYRRNW